jgi:CBS domain-containing protein
MSSRELAIRVRRTETNRWQGDPELTVRCPLVQSSVGVEVCAECGRREQISINPEKGEPYVRCRVPAELDRTPLESPQAAWAKLLETEHVFSSLLERTPVSRLMTSDVTCVSPSLQVEELTELLLSRRISGAPVVNGKGHPVGMVSKTDLVREHYVSERFTEDQSLRPGVVRDVMTPTSIQLAETATLGQATALMAQEQIHRLPIVSEDGDVVGILSALDVVRWLALQGGYIVPGAGRPE